MDLLKVVLEGYEETKKLTNRKVIDIGSPPQIAITKELPAFLQKLVIRSEFPVERYKFKGSYGQNNFLMADIPWVATFDTRITTSAQEGYDIVLLFGREMKSCVLSLNQGYTAFTKEFKKESLALKKIKQTAERARANLSPVPGASYGSIDLQAETAISKGYELGAIASFVYELDDLPTAEEFEKNYLDLLIAYDQLYNLAGKDLMSLQALTDSEFQSEIEESLAINEKDEDLIDPIGPEIKPNKLPSVAGTKYKRDVNKSKRAIKRSGYVCLVDPSHESFLSEVTKKRYVEAHHLIPMSAQDDFENSLDVSSNIVSLCPNCHRLIHHGIYSDKVKLIKTLFALRKNEIKNKGIVIDELRLLNIYKRKIEETD